MIGAFVIAFREVIEAGLIIGIVLAATRGIAGRGRWIGLGVVGGLAGACLVALFAEAISDAFEGAGQDILNAAVLATAVIMLIWHNTWMSRHGRELAGELKAAGESVRRGETTSAALAFVVGAAILREGAELVLFLYGLVASGTSGPDLQIGALAGVGAGILISAVSYFGLAAIPTRYVFSVTSALIIFLAAGLAAQAAQFLTNAGLITVLDRPLWNTANILSEGSMVGRVLHALVGYTDRPTGLQVIVYLGTILVMIALMQWSSADKRRRTLRTA
ncbi:MULTISPECIES: FTR1 family iron permease [Methylobacterium]|uniref:Ferrous iron permease EfeU n=1 Tax=Methylobacterium bullatum TaxID=570505 RepID=A0AAV4Z5V8_9HYPH|nr:MULTISPECIES: FTR1 family protein [Methylobacterium]KQO51737.1 iron permease [Methylobacterium sp. Leaf85]MBD8902696.1 iron permease [Methylobacterium bullatum]GJD39360.1 Ferrous iron permease EfeU [Methylobacterium bullatum]